jgi:peptidoglycan/LPS O-acetylase OafA/YrhL
MDYRREIDGLRALAVLPVIFFHAGFQTFSGGFVGVDVFFVISGYLITSIIVAEKQANTFTLINFYERRARRILPALFVVVFFCLPFAWFWLIPQDMKSFSQSLVAVFGFASNFFFWKKSGYFEPSTELNPLLHTWSLAIEEQYYLFFPFFLMLMWRFGKHTILLTFGIVAVFSLAAAQWGSATMPTPTFYLLPTRGWELLIGAFVAFYFSSDNKTQPTRIASEAGGVIGLLMLIYSIFVFDRSTPFPSLYTLIPTIGTALIILFSTRQTVIGKLLGNKLFVSVGLISYSAYLWHQPLFAFARYRSLEEPSKLILSSLVIAAVVLAFFSWKYVEIPFRNKIRFNRKKIYTYATLGSTLFIAIGLVGSFNEGFSNRFINIESILPTQSNDKQRINECFLVNSNVDVLNTAKCLGEKKRKKFNVLLLGDSHAASLYPGLQAFLDKNDVSLGMVTAAYCLPLVENFPKNTSITATSRCEQINQETNKLIESQKFDLVIISSFILELGFKDDWQWTYPGYYGSYIEKIKSINSITKVLVVGEFVVWPNGLPMSVYKEIAYKNIKSLSEIQQYSAFGLDKKLFDVDEKLKADFSAARISYISIVDGLCKNFACMRFVFSESGPKLISPDYGHLGLEASEYISNYIVGPVVLNVLNKGP